MLGIFESDSEIQLARTVTWPGPVLELTMTGERRRPQARAGPPGHRDSGSARGALRHASPCCHTGRLSGGCDLARVRHRCRESAAAAGVERRVLRPLTFPSRLQAATVGAIDDSALQSVDTGSTTGCGRLGGLGRLGVHGLIWVVCR